MAKYTDAMLQAAVNKAVENGLLPKAAFYEVIAENWRRMEECTPHCRPTPREALLQGELEQKEKE